MRKFSFVLLAVLASLGFAQDDKLRFVIISHMNASDPNMLWITSGMEQFKAKYPDAEAEFVAPSGDFSLPSFIELIQQVIATNPDGIAVPILNAEAMDPVLRDAMDQGIAVVAFNGADGRPAGEKIPYLTYVGGDLYQDGYKAGAYAIQAAKDGRIPAITKVLCANPVADHAGLLARCNGMIDVMKEAGIETEMLNITADPERAATLTEAYLSDNADVNLVYNVTTFSTPWVYTVAQDMGLSPDVDMEGVTMIGVDESPLAIEGVKQGKLLSTHSQGFMLQGYLPFEWLYFNKALGYVPQSENLVGPVIIDQSNAETFEKLVRTVFGDEAYDSQGAW
jgi:simple sugar transport system substrate-binding protein